MSDVDRSVKLSVRLRDWILDKELDGEGKETLDMLRGIHDEVEEMESKLEKCGFLLAGTIREIDDYEYKDD